MGTACPLSGRNSTYRPVQISGTGSIPREFADTNPCIAIPKFVTENGGARPWPVWAFDLIESHARDDIRRAVRLARYTGQRQADVLRMTMTDLEDGGINVTQQKTGKRLWIPLYDNLRPEMERWETRQCTHKVIYLISGL